MLFKSFYRLIVINLFHFIFNKIEEKRRKKKKKKKKEEEDNARCPILISRMNSFRLTAFTVPVWILCLHWLIWTGLLSEAIDINCCQNGTTWMAGRNCSDGSNIRIKCTLGFYQINSEEEDFNITETENGTVLTEIESLLQISQDK